MKNKRDNYETPEMEVIAIEVDVITTSGGLFNAGSGSGDGKTWGFFGV